MKTWGIAFAGFVVLLFSGALYATHAADFTGLKLSDGTSVQYAVAFPDNFDAKKKYPTILALPPGRQGRRATSAGLKVWEGEAKRRGYFVISPIAKKNELFFKEGARIFPEFIDKVLKLYPIAKDKLHLAGISNGGLSAFRIAQRHPQYFKSLTVLPGFPPRATSGENLANLKSMRIQMYVGANDTRWVSRMSATKKELKKLNIPARLEIIADTGHRIASLRGAGAAVLFDRLGE